MIQSKKVALVGAIALVLSASAFAQTAASDAMAAPMKKSHGTTMHQKNKAMKLHGASAAAAASAMGTNDKGQPQ